MSGPQRLEDLLSSLQTISELQSRGALRDVQPQDREAYLAKLTAQADQIKALMAALAQPTTPTRPQTPRETNGNQRTVHQGPLRDPNANPGQEDEEELYVNLGPGSRFGQQGKTEKVYCPPGSSNY